MSRQIFKKIFFVLSGVIIITLTINMAVWAENSGKGKISPVEEKAKVLAEAKIALDNTSWKIELKPMATGKKKPKGSEEDVLRFVNNQIISDKLETEGFSSSNYTVRIKGKNNDIIIWETMQMSEDKGVAFWRGEIRKGRMRGVLSWHISESKKKSYNFASMAKEIIPEKVELPELVVEEVEEFVEIPVE